MKKRAIVAAIVLGIFLIQLCMVIRVPDWGFNSPFPFTILRSFQMPLILVVCAALSVIPTRSASERTPLYLIIGACAVQIVAIIVMLWLGEPKLVMLVLLLNAFIAAEFLLYGYVSLYVCNDSI
jgi:hypothetical protein